MLPPLGVVVVGALLPLVIVLDTVTLAAAVNSAPVVSHAFTVMVWVPLPTLTYVFTELLLVL